MEVTCVRCQVALRKVKVGITVVVMFNDPPQPYQLYKADLLRCSCGIEIVSGFGQRPYAEHFQPDFQAVLERARDKYYIYERVEDAREAMTHASG